MTGGEERFRDGFGRLRRVRGTGAPPCRACGHDLRGLPRDGACTECGTPVSESFPFGEANGARAAWRMRTAVALRRLVLCRWLELGIPALFMLIALGGGLEFMAAFLLIFGLPASILVSAIMMVGVTADLYRAPTYRPGASSDGIGPPLEPRQVAVLIYVPSFFGFLRVLLPAVMFAFLFDGGFDPGSPAVGILLVAIFSLWVWTIISTIAGLQIIAKACGDAGLGHAQSLLQTGSFVSGGAYVLSVLMFAVLGLALGGPEGFACFMAVAVLVSIPMSMIFLRAANMLDGREVSDVAQPGDGPSDP